MARNDGRSKRRCGRHALTRSRGRIRLGRAHGRAEVDQAQTTPTQSAVQQRWLHPRIEAEVAVEQAAADHGAFGLQMPYARRMGELGLQVEGRRSRQRQAQRLGHLRQRRPAQLQRAMQPPVAEQRSGMAVEAKPGGTDTTFDVQRHVA